MSNHEASAQMNGYLYQIRYALLLLLENENLNYRVSIEKFDDISFDDGYSLREMIQTKHHSKPGNLMDKSADLWRTIKIWLDQLVKNPYILSSCRFLIITTEIAEEHSAVALLRHDNRDEKRAVELLKATAKGNRNSVLKAVCEQFNALDNDCLIKLFKSVEIIDGAPSIVDVEQKLKNRIRLSCYPGFEDRVMEQVEGWWFKLAVDGLSKGGTLVDFSTAQSKIVSVGQQYQPDNLPIEQWTSMEVSDEELTQDRRAFVQQLRLIEEPDSLLRRAIKNYYRASQQRSNWAREELLLPNEIERYERRLIDEWDQCKAFYDERGDPVKQGKLLYKEVMDKNLFIRKLCTEPFIMRGSYEMLSDRLEVGWHKDYLAKMDISKDQLGRENNA